jgi:O-succinylbenzoate synthase
MARAALEMSAHDLAARRSEQSLAAFLGGTRDRVETGIVLGMPADPSALAPQVTAAVDAGYRRIKLKVAPGADAALVDVARRAAGPAFDLSVDANGSYTVDDTPALQRLEAFELVMIEQPLPAGDLAGSASLQRVLATPICLDESIRGPEDAAAMVRLGAGRIINIKPGRVGGHGPARRIHDFAVANGVPVWCGGMLESGVGRAHNVALASLPGFTLAGDLSPSSRYWERDLVTPEWTMRDGALTVPRDRPGIGVDVDVDYVESAAVRRARLTGR